MSTLDVMHVIKCTLLRGERLEMRLSTRLEYCVRQTVQTYDDWSLTTKTGMMLIIAGGAYILENGHN